MYKTTVVVDGMHCSMCEFQVRSLVMKILPDAKLSASHRKGTLTIEGSFIPSGNLVRKALKDGGYEVKYISTEKVEKKPGQLLGKHSLCLATVLNKGRIIISNIGLLKIEDDQSYSRCCV